MSQLSHIMVSSLEKNSRKNLVSLKGDFVYRRYSYGSILELSKKFSKFLEQNGIRKGDRICICSYNCPQYFFVMLGAMFSGVIIVPVDFATSDQLTGTFMKLTRCRMLITSIKKSISTSVPTFYVEELEEMLSPLTKKEPVHVGDDHLVEILFTSGTTGDPKGVMLTHDNICSNMMSALSVFKVYRTEKLLSLIPLSHMLEQCTGFFGVIFAGAETTQLRSRRPSEILKVIRYERTTMIVAVPAFYNLFKRKIEEKAEKSGKLQDLRTLLTLAQKLPMPARRLLFRKLHSTFGGKLRCVVSGGASLPPETELFWDRIGIPVINGYGLTETSPILSINTLGQRRFGSVGKPIPGVRLRVSEEGEILARGPNITQGYYLNPKATSSLLQKGWLHTGDCGEIDKQGYVYIKGRIKNMILKANGLNVYPEDIELLLDSHPLVKESCVLGIEKGTDVIITAILITRGMSSNSDLKEMIDSINKKLEQHQQIQDFCVWPRPDFPKTHTMKIKRLLVASQLQRCEAGIESSDELSSILSELSHKDHIKDEHLLYSDLGFDSLKTIELSTLIEEKLAVDIDEAMIDAKTTVRSLKEIISRSEPSSELPVSRLMFSPVFKPFKLILPEIAYLVTSRFFSSFRIEGRENLSDVKGPVIIITNHTSHLDIPTITKHLPFHLRTKMATAAAADYFFVQDGKLISRAVAFMFNHLLGAFPMSRDKKALRRTSLRKSLEFIGEIADKGWSLAIAPEGTRSRTGKMGHFKNGIGIIVKETGYPVIPVKVKGLFDIMPPKTHFPRKRGPVEIVIGKPVRFSSTDSPVMITRELESIVRKL